MPKAPESRYLGYPKSTISVLVTIVPTYRYQKSTLSVLVTTIPPYLAPSNLQFQKGRRQCFAHQYIIYVFSSVSLNSVPLKSRPKCRLSKSDKVPHRHILSARSHRLREVFAQLPDSCPEMLQGGYLSCVSTRRGVKHAKEHAGS